MVVQIRILDNSNHCLEMYSIIILYITNEYLTNEQVIDIVLSDDGDDGVREVELACRGTIEPTNGACRSGPNDVATAEGMPEGKHVDEQEESNHYIQLPGQSC